MSYPGASPDLATPRLSTDDMSVCGAGIHEQKHLGAAENENGIS